MSNLSNFLDLSKDLSRDYGLPGYQARLVVARASGAITIADLMRKLKCEAFVDVPSFDKIFATMKGFSFLDTVEKKRADSSFNKKVYYMLVRR